MYNARKSNYYKQKIIQAHSYDPIDTDKWCHDDSK